MESSSKTAFHQCDDCNKVFTKKRNLTRHVRSIHSEEKPHRCRICSKKFARKQNKDLHQKTCFSAALGLGISKTKKSYKQATDLKLLPRLQKSLFKGNLEDWIIEYPKENILPDPTVLLKTSAKLMKEAILKYNIKHTYQSKLTMSIHVVFEKAVDIQIKTVPPIVLTTSPYTVYLGTDIDKCLDDAAEKLFDMIQEYEGCGSGWVIDRLVRLDTKIVSISFL